MFHREEPRRFEIAGVLGAIGNEFLAACVFDKSPKAKQDVAQMIANQLITWWFRICLFGLAYLRLFDVLEGSLPKTARSWKSLLKNG
jgi:hypothetical protein